MEVKKRQKRFLNIQRTSTSDFDEFAELIKNGFVENKQLGRGKFQAHIKTVASENVIVCHLQHNRKLYQTGTGIPGYITFLIWDSTKSTMNWRYSSVQETWLPVLWNIDHESIVGDDFEGFPISIEENFFIEKCLEFGREAILDSLKANHLFRVTEEKLENLRTFVKLTGISSMDAEWFETMAVELIISCFDSHSYPFNHAQGKVKRVVDYMLNNLDSITTINEVSSALNIPARSLRQYFQSELSLSPKEALTMLRLNAVHNSLKSRAQNESIRSVAAHYNFWHSGQFAADFKKQFGVFPHNI